MELDFNSTFQSVFEYAVKRIQTFSSSNHSGPGEAGEKIRYLEFGYEVEQANWVALIFDTRVDAKPDGEWTMYLENTLLAFEDWTTILDKAYENEVFVSVKRMDGTLFEIPPSQEGVEALSMLVGEMLKEVLFKLKVEGVLFSLPLSENAFMGVEDINGYWGWPPYDRLRDEGIIHCADDI